MVINTCLDIEKYNIMLMMGMIRIFICRNIAFLAKSAMVNIFNLYLSPPLCVVYIMAVKFSITNCGAHRGRVTHLITLSCTKDTSLSIGKGCFVIRGSTGLHYANFCTPRMTMLKWCRSLTFSMFYTIFGAHLICIW